MAILSSMIAGRWSLAALYCSCLKEHARSSRVSTFSTFHTRGHACIMLCTGVSGISPIPDLKIPSFCPEILHTGSLRVVDIGPVIVPTFLATFEATIDHVARS